MIRFPTTVEEILAKPGQVRAGGTDQMALASLLAPSGPIVDLRDVRGLDRIEPLPDEGLRIGARVTLARLASHAQLQERWSAVADAAAQVATPQVRARATLAGNLLQEVRCPYFRLPS